MIRLKSSTARWSNTKAWMVDYTGLAVPIENHVQKGEPVESQLDEYGIACALRYGELSHNSEYYQAAAVLAWDAFLDELTVDSLDDMVDVTRELEYTLEPENITLFLKALGLSNTKLTAKELLDIYEERGIDAKIDSSIRSIRTLFERLMMRVRVGGVINTPSSGTTDIYFRIPDNKADAWYKGICNFLYDHPQYAGFTLHIYEEADTAGERREMETYTDGKEFLDLHSSKSPESFAARRLNAAYRRKDTYARRFVAALRQSGTPN